MTAIDISETFINTLQRKVKEQQLDIEVIHANVLTQPLNSYFDGAFCMGNSFGYFPYEKMNLFVKKISDVLKPGGNWITNTGLAAESFLANYIHEKKYELGDLTMHIRNDYDSWHSCLLTTLTYTKNNLQEIQRFKSYVYTVAEIIRLLKKQRLKTIALYSSTDKTVYHLGGTQLFLVAQKESYIFFTCLLKKIRLLQQPS